MAVDEVSVSLLDGPVDRLGGDDAKYRVVARAQSLRADNHIGLHSPVFHGKVPTGPADSRHDFIDDEKDVVAVAYLPDPLEITVFRDQGAGGGTHHRFGHEGGNRVGAFVNDRLFQVVGAFQGAAFRLPAAGAAVAVGGDDVGGVLDQGLVVAPPPRMAA